MKLKTLVLMLIVSFALVMPANAAENPEPSEKPQPPGKVEEPVGEQPKKDEPAEPGPPEKKPAPEADEEKPAPTEKEDESEPEKKPKEPEQKQKTQEEIRKERRKRDELKRKWLAEEDQAAKRINSVVENVKDKTLDRVLSNRLLVEIFTSLGRPAVKPLMGKFSHHEAGFAARIAVAELTGKYFASSDDIGAANRWWNERKFKEDSEIRAEVSAELLEKVRSGDVNEVRRAAFAMQFVKNPEIIKALSEMLGHGDLVVRHRALCSLTELGASEALSGIEKHAFLQDLPPIGTDALFAIGKLGNESHLPILREFLEKDNVQMRVAAAQSMLKLGDRSVLEELKKIVKQEPGELKDRAYALRVLVSTGDLGLIDFLNGQLYSEKDFSFREIGHAIEVLLHRSFGFYDKDSFRPSYNQAVLEEEIARREEVVAGWVSFWEKEKGLSREGWLIEHSLTSDNWMHRYMGYRELKKLSGKDFPYDPFGSQRANQIETWRAWLVEKKP